ncbi:hypothetical protein VPH35_065592 [Triticum aestivum]|uniref:Uncharacterized protein n=1 Tax=Triticum urartu TaxID=4572 RepID=A0A8R7U5U3_TRIUA
MLFGNGSGERFGAERLGFRGEPTAAAGGFGSARRWEWPCWLGAASRRAAFSSSADGHATTSLHPPLPSSRWRWPGLPAIPRPRALPYPTVVPSGPESLPLPFSFLFRITTGSLCM